MGGGQRPRFRVPAATVPDGLLLDVPKDADYPPPYALNMAAVTLSARVTGLSHGSITVRLSTEAITP